MWHSTLVCSDVYVIWDFLKGEVCRAKQWRDTRVFGRFFSLYAKPDGVAGRLGFGFVCLFFGLTAEYTE